MKTPGGDGRPVRVGFERRLAAAAIDLGASVAAWVVVGGMTAAALSIGPGGAATAALEQAGLAEGARALRSFGGFFIGANLAVVGYGLIEALTGASPGKWLLGVAIGAACGRRAGHGRLVARWLVKYAGVVLVVAGILTGHDPITAVGKVALAAVFVGCLMAVGDQRLALHDVIAGTAVFERAALRPPVP